MISLETVNKKAALRPANLFFVELIIVLLFFSFSTAVILQVFAEADQRQKESTFTERAIICSQAISEVYSVTGSPADALALVFGEEYRSSASAGEVILDTNFKPDENGVVVLSLYETGQESEAGRLSQLRLSFGFAGESEIYSSSCYAYISNGGSSDA